MPWSFTDDPHRYAEHVLDLLTARPDVHTVPLTVLETLRAGQRFSDVAPLFGWYGAAGEITGAISMTPPYGVLLAELPPGSEDELAAGIRERAAEVPDTMGTVDAAGRFAASWTAGTGLRTEVAMRQRVYTLDGLRPPTPPPAGRARAAVPADLDVVMDWVTRFHLEAEASAATPQPEMYLRRIELGLLWLWLDEQARPVSMASRNVTVAGVSRIGPVYTPPDSRRRGYGAAVTAACTQDALDCGARQVVLFTDEANPTSNGIYQQLGYRALDDRLILRFVGAPDQAGAPDEAGAPTS
ncbi:MAG TPA: GNAT family N-acetyltransferase [Jatrophihabitans sp.]|jgi:predicted GNAT family acetyltransferase|uniref:GNAT family N-acetyltransferase n=1 Tax=Jatrophihabitans sp. TaxID=1932789 RepID=UPI002F259B63